MSVVIAPGPGFAAADSGCMGRCTIANFPAATAASAISRPNGVIGSTESVTGIGSVKNGLSRSMLYPQSSMMIATRGAPDGSALGDAPGNADADGDADGDGGATVGATDGSSPGATATWCGAGFGANIAAISCRSRYAPTATAASTMRRSSQPHRLPRRRDRPTPRRRGVTD